MTVSDLRAFAQRDWVMLARAKSAHWAKVKRESGAGEALRTGDELRRHAQSIRPGWPTREDRRLDIATHARVAAALRRVGPPKAR